MKQKQGTNFENEYLSSRHGFIIIISIIEDSRNVDQRSEEEDGTCQDRQTDRKKECPALCHAKGLMMAG